MKILRTSLDVLKELKRIADRTNLDHNDKINSVVKKILNEVKDYGDKAVEKYTEKYDGFLPAPMQISEKDLKDAWINLDPNLQSALKNAKERIETFHEKSF